MFRAFGPTSHADVLQGMKQFDIDLIVISELHNEQVIYLRQVGGEQFNSNLDWNL